MQLQQLNMPVNSVDYGGLFKDIFNYPEYLMGERQAEEPAIVEFLNGYTAACILSKHMRSNSKIAIHTDVDMDGIGSCYVFRNWMRQVAPFCNVDCWINQEKVHGVADSQINFLNSNKYELVVILDSATNDINYIRNLNCDCIVIDHHEISINKEDMVGTTVGGNYVIVNSMADNLDKNYIGNDMMSAGLTVYEFLRYFQYGMGLYDYLSELKLYQWAVITLFTDCINNDNLRNIYYIQKSRAERDKEPGLAQILASVDCRSNTLNKSDIGFTLAPLFNRAIRAGYGGYALELALTQPTRAKELQYFRQIQEQQVSNFEEGANYNKSHNYVTKDITNTNVSPSYAGLVAMKLCDRFSATSIVYRDIGDGYVGGSFRGAYQEVDYRKHILDMGYYAAGHKSAFGFKFPKDKVDEIMSTLVSFEKKGMVKEYLTAGDVVPRGIHHIENLKDFQSQSYLWRLGNVNSIMATNINILVSKLELEYRSVNSKHTYFTYDFHGVELRAFEEITSSQAYIYVEYQDTLRLYVKNKLE